MTEIVNYEIYDYYTGKAKFTKSRKKAREYFAKDCLVFEFRIIKIQEKNGDAITIYSKKQWRS